MSAPNQITPKQLLRLIGTPDCPRLIDIRTPEDFASDPFLIPASERFDHTDPQALSTALRGDRTVIICQKGKKLSQGLASFLQGAQVPAEVLQGGMFGWRDLDGAPRVPAAALPASFQGATLWVMRQRPKIDRIACPWLIRRFLDRCARFLFVAPGEVIAAAEHFGATPIDVPGAVLSHRGNRCSFDAILEDFALETDPLRRMAEVIRAADTNRHDLHPAAAGLLAISVGLSRQYRNDHEQLNAGLGLYDALYRWARDGFEEGHDWSEERV
ncbi:MAG: chromate resistance protein ChrB domain-containing protein [Pseudomonadota bacterium]